MEDVATQVEQLLAKESWAVEDIESFRELLRASGDPNRHLRQAAGRLAADNPDPSGAAAVKQGVVLYLLHRHREAAEILAQGTDNKERRFYQGQALARLRDYDKAIEAFERAEDRGWEAKQVTLEIARLQVLAGDLEAAATSVDRFARSSEDDPDWRCVAGMVLEAMGQYDRAVEHYEAARGLQPSHPAATFRLAYYYDLHGEESRAVELYRECVAASDAGGAATPERRPVYANALLNLAVLYEDAGRYDDAIRCLRRILAANPGHERARLFLRDAAASKTMVFDEDEAKRTARRNDLLAIPVTDFELSVRARNCLKKMNIRTLGDLLRVTEPELLSYKNFGETSLAEIKQMLASKGLRLGQMLEEGPALDIPEEEEQGPAGNEGLLATPLSQIEFSVRSRRALENLGVNSLGDLAAKTEAELLACRNFGQTSLNEVTQRLAEYGLRLRESH
jgi:DNA-directed RNA polymerase subunit alpha